MENKDDIILTTQKEIREFLELKGKFEYGFIETDYNAKITLKGVKGWEERLFRVYENAEENVARKIVCGKVKIVHYEDYIVKEGVVERVKSIMYRGKIEFVYKVKVSEIEKIKLEKRKGGK